MQIFKICSNYVALALLSFIASFIKIRLNLSISVEVGGWQTDRQVTKQSHQLRWALSQRSYKLWHSSSTRHCTQTSSLHLQTLFIHYEK